MIDSFYSSTIRILLESRRNAARQIAVNMTSCLSLSWAILIMSPTISAAEMPSINMDTASSEVRQIFLSTLECVVNIEDGIPSKSHIGQLDMYQECRSELCYHIPGTDQYDCSLEESNALQLLVLDAFEKLLITSANMSSLMGSPSNYTTEINNGYQSYLSDRQFDCTMQSVIFQNQHKYFTRRCLEKRDWEQFVLYRSLSLGLEAARRNLCGIEPTNVICASKEEMKE